MSIHRILITGADGFIGRHVAAALREAGLATTLAVRGGKALPDGWHDVPDLRVIETGDLASADLAPLLAGVDNIVHLAGRAGLAGHRPDAEVCFRQANVTTTARLVEAARDSGVRKFIYLSSIMAVTGNAATAPVDDRSVPAPTSPYGRSKLEAERHVAGFADGDRLAVSLRPPLVIAGDAVGNWARLQALAATGLPLPFATLRRRRSFIAAASLAETIVRLCGAAWPGALSGAYCVADPEALPLCEVMRELRAGMGRPQRLFPCPALLLELLGRATGRRQAVMSLIGRLEVDASRFASSFGFTPKSRIRDAIRRSGADYASSAERR